MINRLALLAVSLVAGAAHAETRHLEATGSSLAIATPCARAVTIQPDPSLSGKYVLDATADHPEETARLVFDSGAAAKLHTNTGECESRAYGNGNPTLELTLRVPPGSALAIDEAGGARYTIGAVGKLTLDVSGGVDLSAASVQNMALDLSGGAAIKIGRIDGTMKVALSGGGDIRVDHAKLTDLTLSVNGGGAFNLTDGAVSRLTLDLSGAGSVTVGAPVTDATISMSGAGAVHLAQVTGHLTKDMTGVGSLEIDKH